jgi:hypothetical protein
MGDALSAVRARRYQDRLTHEYFYCKLMHYMIINRNKYGELSRETITDAAIADLASLDIPFERLDSETVRQYADQIWRSLVKEGFATKKGFIDPIYENLKPKWKYYDEYCRFFTVFIFKLLIGEDVQFHARGTCYTAAFDAVKEILDS